MGGDKHRKGPCVTGAAGKWGRGGEAGLEQPDEPDKPNLHGIHCEKNRHKANPKAQEQLLPSPSFLKRSKEEKNNTIKIIQHEAAKSLRAALQGGGSNSLLPPDPTQ